MRLFIGIKLPNSKAHELYSAYSGLRAASGKIRWLRIENYHITLFFLGNKHGVKDVIDRGKKVFRNFHSFKISVTHADFFGTSRNPKVLVCHVKDSSGEMDGIYKAISSEFSEISGYVNKEGEFLPHVTLGRFKHGSYFNIEEISLKNKDFYDKISFTADKIILFNSILNSAGAEYEYVYVWKLKRLGG